MGQPQVIKDKYTIEEWLALEQETGERYEYHHGEVFSMAGGTLPHGRISGNCYRELGNAFEKNGDNCEAFTSDH